MNSIDVVNSQVIGVFPSTQLGMVSVESSKEVKIQLNNATRECKFMTCCSRSVFVRFPAKGVTDEQAAEDSKLMINMPIGEQFETHIDGDTIKTEVMESMA